MSSNVPLHSSYFRPYNHFVVHPLMVMEGIFFQDSPNLIPFSFKGSLSYGFINHYHTITINPY
ncbi:MAG: hypothetical protein CSA95_01125 [Bacteroidetes bacterium]|nr:MAG: hypothetical protein CSA95_01125 [Bacteroidota bacterium]